MNGGGKVQIEPQQELLELLAKGLQPVHLVSPFSSVFTPVEEVHMSGTP